MEHESTAPRIFKLGCTLSKVLGFGCFSSAKIATGVKVGCWVSHRAGQDIAAKSKICQLYKQGLVNKTNLVHKLILSIFINLYMFRATMCPSSGETTVT